MCEFPFSIALWIINTRSIFSLALLKIFWNFWNSSRKKSTQKQPFSGVYKIDVLKKFANFTKKHQCWSHFLKKSPEIKRLQHRCFPVNFVKLLRTPFLQSTSGRVSLLKYFMFRSSTNSYLIVWSFSMLISKTTCPTPFLVSPFSLQPIFFTNEDFEYLSMKKDPFNRIIRKCQPEGVFVDLLEK